MKNGYSGRVAEFKDLLSGTRIDLEEELQHHVDIVSLRDRMNPYLKNAIEQEALCV